MNSRTACRTTTRKNIWCSPRGRSTAEPPALVAITDAQDAAQGRARAEARLCHDRGAIADDACHARRKESRSGSPCRAILVRSRAAPHCQASLLQPRCYGSDAALVLVRAAVLHR